MSVVTLLNAVSANTTGPVAGLGTPYGNLTLSVSTTGTVSAFSVVLQGSNDGFSFGAIGSAITSPTAGTSMGSGVLFQYFQAVLSGYSGTGTVTAELAYSLEAAASGGGGPPAGAAGGDLSGSYPNPTVAQLDGQALPVPISLGGTGTAAGAAQNKVFAGPATGGAGAPSFRSLVAADVPTLNQSTTGTAANLSGTPALPNGTTAATQSGGDSSTKLATTAFVQGALPGAASTSAAGIVELDGTAADIAAPGTQSAGTGTLAAISTHVHPSPSWVPSDNGLLAAYGDPFIPVSTSILTAGSLYLVKLPIRYALTLSYTWWLLSADGAGTSAGSYTGLYSSSGSLLTGSSDVLSKLTGTVGPIQLTLTTPQALSAGTFVWAALLVNLQTTQPTLFRGAGSGANTGLAASAYRIAVNSPSATTVASGSNGGEISQIATWSSPSAGVLDVASVSGYPSSGSLAVAASGSTLASITYTGTSAGQFTGCAYVSGSATGTVATGGAVTMASLPATITPSGNAVGLALWAGGS